jgi:hypothetical protein
MESNSISRSGSSSNYISISYFPCVSSQQAQTTRAQNRLIFINHLLYLGDAIRISELPIHFFGHLQLILLLAFPNSFLNLTLSTNFSIQFQWNNICRTSIHWVQIEFHKRIKLFGINYDLKPGRV